MTKANPVLILSLAQVFAPRNDARDGRKPEHVARMAAHLGEGGKLPPIHVFKREDGKFEVITGETRRQAHIQAGFSEIECIIREEPLTEGELLLERLLENEWREGFNPIERARLYVELMKANGWNQAELAEKVGAKASHVAKTLQISRNLIAELQALVVEGKLHPSHAYLLSQLEPANQAQWGPKVVAENWKRDKLERKVKELRGKRARKAKPVKLEQGNLTVFIPPDVDNETAVEDLQALIKRLRKGTKLGDDDGPVLLPAG